MKDIDIVDIKERLERAGQVHLIQYWDTLSFNQKQDLYDELINIDIENIGSLRDLENIKQNLDSQLEPVHMEDFGNYSLTNDLLLKEYRTIGFIGKSMIGLKNIRQKKVAVILMAGGIGTRLGVNYPKGMYDVGLLSHKSLYQLQAERILKLNQLAHRLDISHNPELTLPDYITWCIMTSDGTFDQTKDFFETHQYFGLDPNCVIFFKQYSIPCLDMEGKIILESPHKIALSPEGNGGLYKALLNSNVIDLLVNKGVQYIHVYGVDNILVKVADPVFLGFCIKKKAENGVKVIEKVDPHEAVGVVCKVNGQYGVVEYSEISHETVSKKDKSGGLVYNCGNIANHFFTMEFLQRACKEHDTLSYHVAKKKIPYVNSHGECVKPEKPNGIKMEKFIFDVFSLTNKVAVWLVERENEFSPLKNADSIDPTKVIDCSPTTCRRDLYRLHTNYIENAHGKILFANGKDNSENGGDIAVNTVEGACEISPIISYDGEDLEPYVKDKVFQTPFLLSFKFERTPSILTEVKNSQHSGDLGKSDAKPEKYEHDTKKDVNGGDNF